MRFALDLTEDEAVDVITAIAVSAHVNENEASLNPERQMELIKTSRVMRRVCNDLILQVADRKRTPQTPSSPSGTSGSGE